MSIEENLFISALAQGLAEFGYWCMPGFLSASQLSELRSDAFSRYDRGEFHRAAVGKAKRETSSSASAPIVSDDIRRDQICWFDEQNLTANERILWSKLELIKLALNRELMLGLWDFEAHYALYPKGAFYRRHLDRFQNDSSRTVSIVIYLNDEWRREDGGELLLYHQPGDREPALRVLPLGGTLAAFLSSEVEHEVTDSLKPRVSIAVWFRRRK